MMAAPIVTTNPLKKTQSQTHYCNIITISITIIMIIIIL